MNYTVYHRKDMFDENSPFEMVAFVEIDDTVSDPLEEVYWLTNNVVRRWTENENVHATATYIRSTSVGDLIESEDGTTYQVDSFGFSKYRPVSEDYELSLLYRLP